MTPSRLATACFTAWLVLAAPAAGAEDPGARELRAAEKAYREVDFPGTYEHAAAGLAAGGARPERVARLATLAGVAAAALERDDEAKVAFVLALAVDPNLKLDRSLSPKLRGPYLEARGYWGAYSDRLSLRATVRGGANVMTRLSDPARLVSKIVVASRVRGESRFSVARLEPFETTNHPLPAAARDRGFDYFVRAVDAYGNTLTEAGSEDAPLSHGASPSAELTPEPAPRRSYLVPVTFAVLGVGAGATGAVFHLKREDAARTWNGPDCERPGSQTRLQQCGEVDEDLRRDGTLAIVSYAAAGVFLTTSVVTWFTGAPRPGDARADTAGRPACGVAGAGLSCSGTF